MISLLTSNPPQHAYRRPKLGIVGQEKDLEPCQISKLSHYQPHDVSNCIVNYGYKCGVLCIDKTVKWLSNTKKRLIKPHCLEFFTI